MRQTQVENPLLEIEFIIFKKSTLKQNIYYSI